MGFGGKRNNFGDQFHLLSTILWLCWLAQKYIERVHLALAKNDMPKIVPLDWDFASERPRFGKMMQDLENGSGDLARNFCSQCIDQQLRCVDGTKRL
jgi:hypothetical protein